MHLCFRASTNSQKSQLRQEIMMKPDQKVNRKQIAAVPWSSVGGLKLKELGEINDTKVLKEFLKRFKKDLVELDVHKCLQY